MSFLTCGSPCAWQSQQDSSSDSCHPKCRWQCTSPTCNEVRFVEYLQRSLVRCLTSDSSLRSASRFARLLDAASSAIDLQRLDALLNAEILNARFAAQLFSANLAPAHLALRFASRPSATLCVIILSRCARLVLAFPSLDRARKV